MNSPFERLPEGLVVLVHNKYLISYQPLPWGDVFLIGWDEDRLQDNVLQVPASEVKDLVWALNSLLAAIQTDEGETP